jgi:hypothetical protein
MVIGQAFGWAEEIVPACYGNVSVLKKKVTIEMQGIRTARHETKPIAVLGSNIRGRYRIAARRPTCLRRQPDEAAHM